MPRDLAVNQIDRCVARIVRAAFIWLTPPRATAAARAAAGAEAVGACDALLRLALAAGISSTPDDRHGAAIVALRDALEDEAASLAAWAARPDADDEPAEPAPVRCKAGRR